MEGTEGTSSLDDDTNQGDVFKTISTGPNGLSTSPSSNISLDIHRSRKASRSSTSDNHSISEPESDEANMHASLESNGAAPLHETHVVELSAIEQCMPRAYIRICLAYRLPDDVNLDEVTNKLNAFARRLVDAKPYLAGYVVPAPTSNVRVGLSQIQFTDDDFLHYPKVDVKHLSKEDVPYTYDQLDKMALPPSVIRPDLVSALPEGTDDANAPAFRLQANVVEGGLIVSVYLHHCIADGTGLNFLLTGAVFDDEFTFYPDRQTNGHPGPSLNSRLHSFALKKTMIRQRLSWSDPNQISNRQILNKQVNAPVANHKERPPGRGCLLAFSREKLQLLEESLKAHTNDWYITPNDSLQAFLWHHMTKARKPSILNPSITRSKLLIPKNIRKHLKDPIPETSLGAAVDFATAELEICTLTLYGAKDPAMLAETAITIRAAINQVDEAYVRQVIALALVADPNMDVRDLMASNMDRADGADMYITSWEKLGSYNATLDMGLGRPDWIRKPWSKDPGSCVIMPSDERMPYLEVLVQLTAPDMERLLADDVFMSFVTRCVE